MSLDVKLIAVRRTMVFDANITHNLNEMAEQAGIYEYLWHPEKIGIKTAGELVVPLIKGLKIMMVNPTHFKKYDSPNGWGTYEDFVPWIKRYLDACKENPDAEIEVSR